VNYKASIVCATLCGLLSATASAEQDFSEVDNLLKQIEQHAANANAAAKTTHHPSVVKQPSVNTESGHVVQHAPDATENVAVAMNASGAVEQPLEVIEIDNTDMPPMKLSQIPADTRFTMKKSIFFPANRGAMVFVGGEYSHSMLEGKSVVDIFTDNRIPSNVTTCALTSTKSYLLLRGKDRPEKQASFLDVQDVKLFTGNINGDDRIAYSITFSPKVARDTSIGFSATCILPVAQNTRSELSELTLDEVENGFKGVFEIALPAFTEI